MKDETEKVPVTEVWWSGQYYGFTGPISNCLVSDNPGSLARSNLLLWKKILWKFTNFALFAIFFTDKKDILGG